MSLAPLHGRPAPLVFSGKQDTKWPKYRPADLKGARLTTRARKARNRRRARIALALAGVVTIMTAVFWAWLSMRG
jgi:hypothetical protein